MTVNSLVVSIILGTVIPIVVGLVTKLNASRKLKGGLLVTLSAFQAFVVSATMSDGSASFSRESTLLFFVGLATSLAMHYGVYVPVEVPNKLAPEFGLGPKAE
jgi:ABC-type uncharacterized transport system permease subunit